GARQNNLKNISLRIPHNQVTAITGVSGSGKSSLAFDTIYAEGQRRYVESLSAYARQFLGQMEKPDVDYIEGLSPAISIDQKSGSRNPRSTVATVTEVYDYLRLLFARAGRPHCPKCGREVQQQTVQQMVDAICSLPESTRYMILAPLVQDRKGEYSALFEDLRRAGYVRVRVDGVVHEVSDPTTLDRNRRHSIEVVVDRLMIPSAEERAANQTSGGNGAQPDPSLGRVTDSVETALKLSGGVMLVSIVDGEELLFSEQFACVYCGISLGEIAPRTFSFNSPHGACPDCTGLGVKLEVDPDLIIPNKNLSLAEGAVQPWQRSGSMNPWYSSMITSVAQRLGFSTRVPVRDLAPGHLEVLLYGDKGTRMTMQHETRQGHLYEWETSFEGVIPNLTRRYRETDSDYVRTEIERYMSATPCPTCKGKRLKPEALAVTVAGKNVAEATAASITEALRWVEYLSDEEQEPPPLTPRERIIAHLILKELKGRLGFLVDVGLDYITLDRGAATLSGGEAQRIRLATQIGSGLMGVLYVCDEPSIGLHALDNSRLINTLVKLRDLGNTIIIVEHDEAIMRAADHIIDMGPGAGEHGGELVASGTIQDVIAEPRSITGQYLAGIKEIPLSLVRKRGNGKTITIKGARENNLKNVDVEIPLGTLVCITGVSGSGKSTLVYEILYKKLAQLLYKAKDKPGACDAVVGVEQVDKVINIDQSPIGRTPRSNPATYTGAFTPIRELFASVPEARMRGYTPGRFSFNVKGGRCEACRGEGFVQIEMHFLPDIEVPCEVCKGQRYNREALEVHFKDKTIAEVLNMTVEEAAGLFDAFPAIKAKLDTLNAVGLSYIRLGQPATTLSGGEAQRVKLSTELARRATGRTMYILDEPTTGLAFEDAAALLRVLQRLVEGGNTVVLIEHHLDMIKNADWIIDLGPHGGAKGGYVVCTGTPEEVAQIEESFTGQYLRQALAKHAVESSMR
ncbi:MAG TPA: excinuclease ABC subunit UvrA, partial [Dehalococcoidia bacterium]|nr:excinuclease ABC subunit UvrA [Dehalococcoidia bacterium]